MGTAATDLTPFLAGDEPWTKHYTNLHALSQDAFLARIWLGIHFRDAMDDARFIGEKAARLVDSRLPPSGPGGTGPRDLGDENPCCMRRRPSPRSARSATPSTLRTTRPARAAHADAAPRGAWGSP